MASSSSADSEGPITSINVTPLVDILLVVLIIFMATAPLIQRRAVKVDVPESTHHERAALESLAVVFNEKRELFLAGRKLDQAQLSAELVRRAATAGGLSVTLAADRGLPYGEIVRVLDVVRGAGVKRIGLEVKGR